MQYKQWRQAWARGLSPQNVAYPPPRNILVKNKEANCAKFSNFGYFCSQNLQAMSANCCYLFAGVSPLDPTGDFRPARPLGNSPQMKISGDATVQYTNHRSQIADHTESVNWHHYVDMRCKAIEDVWIPERRTGSTFWPFLTWSDSPVSELSSTFRSLHWSTIPSTGNKSPGQQSSQYLTNVHIFDIDK